MRDRKLSNVRLDEASLAMCRRQLKALALVGLLGLTGVTGALRGARRAESTPTVLRPASVRAADAAPIERAEPIKVAPLVEVDPTVAGLDPSRLDGALAAVRREVQREAFPGAALAIGRGPDLVLLQGVGRVSWNGPAVDPANTVYDLASLTKVVGTTTAIMLLVEDGKLDLDAPVQRYLPEFSGDAKALVTIRHLLSHTSGLPAGTWLEGLSREEALRKIMHIKLVEQPGEVAVYSDVGMVILFEAAQRAAGEPIPQLLERRVFGPLGMRSTRYTPGEGRCPECAPTLIKESGEAYRGGVHDPIARKLGGVTGNAGLFSTAADMARFAAMLANGGELNGVRIVREETIREFARRQSGAKNRALGWETPESDGSGAGGQRISPRAFGHTGYTGTSLWVDPDRGTWTILLTNRTFDPRASSRIQSLRRRVNDDVALSALEYRPRLAN